MREGDEALETCAIREVAEEVGLNGVFSLQGKGVSPFHRHGICRFA
jgi:8-oxo-dGTP pyrophosphatase MutT (NUDIX family)